LIQQSAALPLDYEEEPADSKDSKKSLKKKKKSSKKTHLGYHQFEQLFFSATNAANHGSLLRSHHHHLLHHGHGAEEGPLEQGAGSQVMLSTSLMRLRTQSARSLPKGLGDEFAAGSNSSTIRPGKAVSFKEASEKRDTLNKRPASVKGTPTSKNFFIFIYFYLLLIFQDSKTKRINYRQLYIAHRRKK